MNFSADFTYIIYSMDETAELIGKWQKGDENAFALLFIKYDTLVFRNAMFMTGNREQAEDILQEVFIAVWNSGKSFNPKKASFVTWLHKITMNRCIDSHRKEHLSECPMDDKIIDSLGIKKCELPEEILIQKLESQRLMKAVSRMDDIHRPVLILKYFNDLPNGDIAEVLNIPLGTVKSRLHNGLKLLRNELSLAALSGDVEVGEAL